MDAGVHFQVQTPREETHDRLRLLAEPRVVDGHIWLQSEALQVIIVDDQGGLWDVSWAGRRGGSGVCQGGPVQAGRFGYCGGASVPVEVPGGAGLDHMTTTMTPCRKYLKQ